LNDGRVTALEAIAKRFEATNRDVSPKEPLSAQTKRVCCNPIRHGQSLAGQPPTASPTFRLPGSDSRRPAQRSANDLDDDGGRCGTAADGDPLAGGPWPTLSAV